VSGVPDGTQARPNSTSRGGTPRRAQAWKIADLLGTCGPRLQPSAQANPSVRFRITSSWPAEENNVIAST